MCRRGVVAVLELFVEVVGAAGSALGALLPYLLGLAAVAVLLVARAGAVLQPHRPAPHRPAPPLPVAALPVAPSGARREAALVA